MEEREYILTLYEIYKNVLSEKERSYFEYHYFEDYSMQEIADNYKVSKAYVGKYLKAIENKLYHFESELNINKKNNEIKKIIGSLDKETREKIEELL